MHEGISASEASSQDVPGSSGCPHDQSACKHEAHQLGSAPNARSEAGITAPEILVEIGQDEIDHIKTTVPGGWDNVQDIYPLSPLQEGMLFHRLMNEESDTYVLSTLFELDSHVHVDALIRGLQQVIERHDVLRTAIIWEQLRRPVQLVYRRAVLPVKYLSLDKEQDTCEQLKERMIPAGQELDLRRAPIGQLLVAPDSGSPRWYALLQLHHLICDHQSLRSVVAELMLILSNRCAELPVPVPYRNYVAEALISADTEAADVYFRRKLADVDESTVPFGLADVHRESTRTKTVSMTLEASAAHQIRDQARRLGKSPARLFHAAWALVVAQTSGRDDLIFGTVMSAARGSRVRHQRMLGMSVNTLPLRLQLEGLTARELVERTDRELSELRKFQYVPLTQAQRCSGISGSAPLFTALLNYRHSELDSGIDGESFSGVRAVARGEAWTNYPVTFLVDDLGEEFVLTAQTDPSIDPVRLVGYVQTAAQSLAKAIAEAPDTLAVRLPILPADERRQLLQTIDASPSSRSNENFVHRLFEKQAARVPYAVAVKCDEQSLTYGELNTKANQLAWHLRERGVGPDQLVGLCLERGLGMVIALLGVLKAGGAYVPLDPDYPPERLAYMLNDAAPRVVIVQNETRGKLPDTSAELVALDDDRIKIIEKATNNPDPGEEGLRPHHLAYVIYTSGSTGRPKGVLIEHRNVTRLFSATTEWFNFNASDVWTLFHSFAFDFSVWELLGALVYGGRVVVVPAVTARSPQDFYKLLCAERVTVLNQTPSAFYQLIEAQANSAERHFLRVVVFGGEALELRMLQPWVKRNGTQKPQLVNMYGITETTVHVTYHLLTRDEIESNRGSPIGRTIPDLQAYVLGRHGELAPIGVIGELFIGGNGVARGYLNRPELTKDRFVSNPFNADDRTRLYRTGDLAYWRLDGMLEYVGRNDHQVKVRGFRIELGEIETQLSSHQQVKEAVVIAREDTPGDKRLVAYVVPTPSNTTLNAAGLRSHLLGLLPEYMLPAAFVIIEKLPMTSNGKLDRRALPPPDVGAYASRDYEPVHGELEWTLAGIWQQLLGVERVGRRDNFFELGGHSLLVVQMMERLRRVGLRAKLRDVFRSPTLADLAGVLAKETVGHWDIPPNLIPPECSVIRPSMLPLIELQQEHIERVGRSVYGGAANIKDIYPLVPLQEGILFHHLVDKDRGDTYVVPTLLSVCSRARLEELISALQSVIDRHDILRTAVLWEALPRPIQVVYRRAKLPVREIELDLRRDPLQQVKEWMAPSLQKMDLQHAPLMHLQVAADPHSDQWYALIQLHHMVIDHVTLETVTSEAVAYLMGRAHRLPEAIPYRNHVAQVLAYAADNKAEEFFRTKLDGIEESTAPFGLANVHADGSRLVEASEELGNNLSKRIRAQARRFSVTAATLFHAGWSLVVARTSGRDDVVFGTVLLGRLMGNAGAHRILGVFINTLPIRLDLSGMSAAQLVEQTQRELVDLISHEQASLETAQRCSGILGSAPLFTSLLNYRHSGQVEDAQWHDAVGVRMLAIQERTNYPIAIAVDDFGTEFTLTAQTDHCLEPHRVTSHLHGAMVALVNALEKDEKRPALALTIRTRDEDPPVTESPNVQQIDYPAEGLIHELFDEQVLRTPEAIAVVYEDESLTYAQLQRKVNQLAVYLRERGVLPDAMVGLCVDRSIDAMVALLGILKAGGAYVPLDPNYPKDRLECILMDAAPKVLITQSRLRQRFASDAAEVISLDTDWNKITQHDIALKPERLNQRSDHLAYVIYTSGSTGTPKGVMIVHRNVLNLWQGLERLYDQVGLCRRVAMNASLNFDASVQQVIQLLSGRTVVIVPEEVRRDPSMLPSFMAKYRIDGIDCTPSQLKMWIDLGMLRNDTYKPRLVLVGGEAIDTDLWDRLADCRDVAFFNVYGPTECTVDVTAARLNGDSTPPHIGIPMANRRTYIVGPSGWQVPQGVIGELYLGGEGVGRGYLNRPSLTAERFLPDRYSGESGARVYRTGDLGRRRLDRNLEYLGRRDHQVKIRGVRIELGEVEVQLARHEDVKQAVVVVREDAPGDKRLAAYITEATPGAINSVEPLRMYLKALLPEQMVPSAFVVLEKLPLTFSGKVDRRALPAPPIDAYAPAQYKHPQTEVEQTLSGIWAGLLRVDKVGRHDNFFDLGGSSLLVLKAVTTINEALDCSLRVTDVYKCPTVKELASRIEGDISEEQIVDLVKEAALDNRIVRNSNWDTVPGKVVLLTGSTGFVGRFLLAQLLQDSEASVYCLVRAASQRDALLRVRTTLLRCNLWRDEYEPRIFAACGDLRLPNLGADELTYKMLSQRVDTIYHCAASMNHLETYNTAKAANVDGAKEILKLAILGRPKVINYVSTLSIFGAAGTGAKRIVHEASSIEEERHLSSHGYLASKWVADKIYVTAGERGIPCNIFRLGLVWADADQGRFDELQNVYMVLKSCLMSGYGIKDYHFPMPPTPVDYVARAIVFLANRHPDGKSIFHISSSAQMREGIFERCNELAGTSLELVSHYDWIRKMKRLHDEGCSLPAMPLIQFAFSMDEDTFNELQRGTRSEANIHFDMSRTHRELERAGISAPILNDELLRICLHHMQANDPDLRTCSEPRRYPILANEAETKMFGRPRMLR